MGIITHSDRPLSTAGEQVRASDQLSLSAECANDSRVPLAKPESPAKPESLAKPESPAKIAVSASTERVAGVRS